MNRTNWIVILLSAAVTLACTALPFVSSSAPLPAEPPVVVTPTPTFPSPTASAIGKPGAPLWWPSDLPFPKTAGLTRSTERQAVWATRDLNVDGIKDFFLLEAGTAGYKTYVITLSKGSIYDLLFVKGGTTFALNLTQGTDSTVLTGQHVGTMHLQVSGAVNLDLDLPLRERFNLAAGSEIAFGTSVPNIDRCGDCEYLVYVHVAPFNGPGNYRSKPAGTFIIDIQVIPGGAEGQEDYRWAQECTLIVKDALSGNFACAGLQDINDSTKRINVIGNWQQPP